MGMVIQMRRAGSDMLASLEQRGDVAIEFLMPDDDDDPAYKDGSIVDIDKAWQAIHFLLTRTAWDASLPQGFLLGGQAVGGDQGYGRVRLLAAAEVKTIAKHLAALPADFIAQAFSFDELEAADIYPSIWDRKEPGDIEYVASHFADLKQFIHLTAERSDGIVIALV